MSYRMRPKLVIAWALLAIAVAVSVALVSSAYMGTRHMETIEVVACDVKRAGPQGADKYLVYTKNEVFQVTDNLVFLRFDSSDDYGKLKNGGEFQVEVVGWRIPFLSQYRNILDVQE